MSPTSSPGAPTLILIPTAQERSRLEQVGGLGTGAGLVALCGLGPVAAAARSAELLARLSPRRVLLLGVAGTHDPEKAPVGSAHGFGEVAVDGIGAGEGTETLGTAELGIPQWGGDWGGGTRSQEPVHDRLPLGGSRGGLLLTVCSASGDPQHAARRRARFPEALAEDMEAFGVALSCHLAGIPLGVIRGISNVAGDRDVKGWSMGPALSSARDLALTWIGEGGR